MKRMLLLSLAAMLFGWCGAYADFADDTIWTKDLSPDYIVAADFSPDGTQVIAATHGGLFFFDTQTGEFIRKFDKPYVTYGKILSACFSENSTKVLLDNADLGYVIWDYVLGDTVKVTKGSDMSVSKGKNVLYVAGGLYRTINSYSFETGEFIESKSNDSLVYSTANSYASYNGQYILLTCHQKITDTYYKHYVKLFDWDNNIVYEVPQYLSDSVAFIRSVEFSQDGKLMAIGGEDGIVRIYDLTQNIELPNGKITKNIKKELNFNISLATLKLSNSNSYLYYCISDYFNPKTEILSTETWERVNSYSLFTQFINAYSDKLLLCNAYYVNLIDTNFTSIYDSEFVTIIYPNPTNGIVNINYEANTPETTSIAVSSNLGETLTVLHNSVLEQGFHTFTWDAGNYSSGTYWCVITTPTNKLTYKIIVNK